MLIDKAATFIVHEERFNNSFIIIVSLRREGLLREDLEVIIVTLIARVNSNMNILLSNYVITDINPYRNRINFKKYLRNKQTRF
jgi:hypothetical protein